VRAVQVPTRAAAVPVDRRDAAVAAYRAGLMPLHATGVTAFRQLHPTLDGRGVLIGILDSGIDPSVPGLGETTEGRPKLVDLRDFSGEGRIDLAPVTIRADSLVVAGHVLRGGSRVIALATGQVWAGLVPEPRFGSGRSADLDGDGAADDSLVVVVARGTGEWFVLADTDADGSLAGERPTRDYRVAREWFSWSAPVGPPRVAVAVNLADSLGTPRLDLVMDTDGHGTHVAGIAAGHALYGIDGFDGVAPGAQLLGLKIADNADGGITTTGSLVRAMGWAIRFAKERNQPLVLNLSFGVGNQREGTARIDALVDSILADHPGVVMTVSTNNDGPGLSTLGFPASASRVLSVGATLPLVFTGLAPDAPEIDPVAVFSSRGGERAGPDLLAPGTAWSAVPRFDAGQEEKSGTSMAAPHVAGLVARLIGQLVDHGASPDRLVLSQALGATARQVPNLSVLDQGAGVPDLGAASRWLATPRSVPDLVAAPVDHPERDAIWFDGEILPERIILRLDRRDDGPALRVLLRSTVPWLAIERGAVQTVGPDGLTVPLRIEPSAHLTPGVRIGTVLVEDADDEGLGVLVRVPVTIRRPMPLGRSVRTVVAMQPGETGREVFDADSGRGLRVTVETLSRDGLAFLALHEPGGAPARESPATTAGYAGEAGILVLDGNDVVPGRYEVAVVAPPTSGVAARVIVDQAPVRVGARLVGDRLLVSAENRSAVRQQVTMRAELTGGWWRTAVVGTGGRPTTVALPIPSWAASMTVDLAMDPDEWSRFTDVGVSLRDRAGRLLLAAPLTFAFGRLRFTPPSTVRGDTVYVVLSPAAAVPTGPAGWHLSVEARYRLGTPADVAGDRPAIAVLEPAARQEMAIGNLRWPAGTMVGVQPLLSVMFGEGVDDVWTRELALTVNQRGVP
jgi:subtilisin family serine protease